MDTCIIRQIGKLGSDLSKIISYYDQPIDERLTNMGIKVRYFMNKKYEAFLRWDEEHDCPLIALNADQTKKRINFLMAHELGYLVIQYGWVPFQSINYGTSEIIHIKYHSEKNTEQKLYDERIINEFAVSFLLPNDTLSEFIETNQDLNYLEMIIVISDNFNISTKTAKNRIDSFLNFH